MWRQVGPDLYYGLEFGVFLQGFVQAGGQVSLLLFYKCFTTNRFSGFTLWFCKPGVVGSNPTVGFALSVDESFSGGIYIRR